MSSTSSHVSKHLPLSLNQQRLWFLNQLDPSDPSYNVAYAADLVGPLNVEALRQSLDRLVHRHESLRTSVASHDGVPFQVVETQPEFTLTSIDLRSASHTDSIAVLNQRTSTEIRKPFILDRAPLFRASLICSGAECYRLLLVMHHIISDGWSRRVLLKELSSLYSETVSHGATQPAPPVAQYSDFVSWQREQVQTHVWRSQVEFWHRTMLAPVPPLRLSRQAIDDTRPGGGRITTEIKSQLVSNLRQLAMSTGVTLFDVLLAGLYTLLHRRSGETDLCVGVASAGRPRIEYENAVGFFVNTLPLRAEVDCRRPFEELIRSVSSVKLHALSNQDIPFEAIVRAVNPDRSEESPFFNVMANYVPWPAPNLDFEGLTASIVHVEEALPKFLLTVYMRPVDTRLHFDLVFRTPDISHENIRAFAEQYSTLLEQVAAEPQKVIGSISLVTRDDRELLPAPDKPLDEPAVVLVPQMVVEIARRLPDQAAIVDDTTRWNYRRLVEESERTAVGLLNRGLQKGQVVAIFGDRSKQSIAAILGTISAGGVMLTLDPELPTARQRRMMSIANAQYALGPRSHVESITATPELSSVVRLNAEDLPPGSGDGCGLPTVDLKPEDPAYVFFTSGTTGSPKAIVGTHKGLGHFLGWQRQRFEVGPHDRSPFATSYSFDPLLREIFLPLVSGATLLLPPADILTSSELIVWLRNHRATLLHAVPSKTLLWLDDTSTAPLNDLRWTFFAGEPLTEELVRSWRVTVQPNGEIANFYGPTESTMVKCFFVLPDRLRGGIQPIGQPLPDTQVLVLNEHNVLCGRHEQGEIVIRTPFLAKGYLNGDPDATTSFGVNPFTSDPADRIYRTGDLGYYDDTGILHYTGRTDFQIKICGVRIEPDEVAAVLATHPQVRQSVVVSVEDSGHRLRLVAHVVASPVNVTTDDLRRHVAANLPAAMIPEFFVFCDNIPLTANGKVDRARLVVPDFTSARREGVGDLLANDIEIEIARIWTEVLKVGTVGATDNFFDLGGHSLAAARILARINRSLGTRLGLKSFFDADTVREQAALFRQGQAVPKNDAGMNN